jgi:hypothetical protein
MWYGGCRLNLFENSRVAKALAGSYGIPKVRL